MIDLKPCPFCGGKVELDNHRSFEDFAGNSFTNYISIIECKECGIAMKRYPKFGYGTTDEQRKDLIDSWNKRTL